MVTRLVLPALLAIVGCGGYEWEGSELPLPHQADAGTNEGRDDEHEPVSLVFQPAFHHALRHSMSTPRATFRFRVPLGRGGERVRVAFRAGSAALRIYRAEVSLSSRAVPLTFSSEMGTAVQARGRAVSDPADVAVRPGEELLVLFEVEGSLGASAIANFPRSYARVGSHSMDGVIAGGEHPRLVGLASVLTEAPPSRAFVALGDSITEGYVDGPTIGSSTLQAGYVRAVDDYRNSWTQVAERLLGFPIANAAVSGQGVDGALANVPTEVAVLDGVTDCLVLVGTNDLASLTAGALTQRLARLFDRLGTFCRVHAGTLLPKERTSTGDLSVVRARRVEVNSWLRENAAVSSVIDFEAATRAPNDIHRFATGLGADGIHPSVPGQAAMAHEAARALAE